MQIDWTDWKYYVYERGDNLFTGMLMDVVTQFPQVHSDNTC